MLLTTVDDINPALPLRTPEYGNDGIYRVMGNAGFISSAVLITLKIAMLCLEIRGRRVGTPRGLGFRV